MKIIKFTLIALLTVVSAFFMFGLLNPQIEVSSHFEVESTISDAFTKAIEPNSISKWASQIEQIEHVSGIPFMAGSKEKCVVQLNNETVEIDAEILNINPYKSFEIKFSNHKFSGTIEMFFSQTGKTTLVNYQNKIEGSNLFYRAMFALSKPVFEAEIQSAYMRYKAYAEE